VSYKYSFDRTRYGDIFFFKESMKPFLDGLGRLRERLDAWNKAEGSPPYEHEVRDLDWMIGWTRDGLAKAGPHGDVNFYSIPVGSLRYFKAGLLLLVHEADEELRRELTTLPTGVIAARRTSIAKLKELSETGMFASLEPAECLWEAVPRASASPSAPPRDGARWDVFISHASEDKEPFVTPLAQALSEKGVRVWLDDFVLRLGDSLRRSIDHGLSASRYGVVVLSPRFFEKEWPQKELDGMAAMEVEGRKVILPVWHDVGVEDVRAYSPMLADRRAIRSTRGVDAVVTEILEVLREAVEPKPPSSP
jgi:hypothetical protein